MIHAAISHVGDRTALLGADYLAPAALIDTILERMLTVGRGRVGVPVAQNARLGLAGLGDFSAAQAALWTWCEARQGELAKGRHDVSLTVVIPPRTASETQRFVAERTGHRARLTDADAGGLLDAVLSGKRRAGRHPSSPPSRCGALTHRVNLEVALPRRPLPRRPRDVTGPSLAVASPRRLRDVVR